MTLKLRANQWQYNLNFNYAWLRLDHDIAQLQGWSNVSSHRAFTSFTITTFLGLITGVVFTIILNITQVLASRFAHLTLLMTFKQTLFSIRTETSAIIIARPGFSASVVKKPSTMPLAKLDASDNIQQPIWDRDGPKTVTILRGLIRAMDHKQLRSSAHLLSTLSVLSVNSSSSCQWKHRMPFWSCLGTTALRTVYETARSELGV